MTDFEVISLALQRGQSTEIKKLVKKALQQDFSPQKILDEGLISGMTIIGQKFQNNEIYVPEVLIAARAMNAGLKILEPELIKRGAKPIGKIAIGTVKGDLHSIGKNLLGMMLRGAGFEVIDLGVDVTPEKFISEAKKKKCKIIALSALLTSTMPAMKEVIDAAKEAGEDFKIMIGGAPVTQNYSDEIGADAYSPDVASAPELAKSLLKK